MELILCSLGQSLCWESSYCDNVWSVKSIGIFLYVKCLVIAIESICLSVFWTTPTELGPRLRHHLMGTERERGIVCV